MPLGAGGLATEGERELAAFGFDRDLLGLGLGPFEVVAVGDAVGFDLAVGGGFGLADPGRFFTGHVGGGAARHWAEDLDVGPLGETELRSET